MDWEQVTYKTKIRVVFYGRVSTEHEAQLSALQNQIQWYYDQLERNPNWKLVEPIETYLDRGITGTQAKKRPGFLRMIEDAKAGKFDMVVTREVSRFGRNTEEMLHYVKKLKALDIQVYYINDNIKTIEDKDGEIKLTMMAMMAQQESRKISERAKAGQYISRNNGVLYGTSNILGYTRIRKRSDSDKRNAIGDKSVPTFAIVPEEAETIRMIFQWYSDGLGLKQIKNKLLATGRKNSAGQVKWFESSISRILSNPMYIGKQQQCKTEVVDFLDHRIKKNKQEDYVLIDGDFEPIITDELFNKVQEIKSQKNIRGFSGERSYGRIQSTDKWINRLECNCGSKFQQYKWRTNRTTGEQIKGYACRHRVVGGSAEFRAKNNMPIDDACSMPSIPGWKFDFMALRIFSEIWKDKIDCIEDTYKYLERYYQADQNTEESRVEHLKKQLKKYDNKLKALVELYTEGDIDINDFRSKKAEYKSSVKILQEELKALEENPSTHRTDHLQELKEALDGMVDYTSEQIDEKVVMNYVDKVVMRSETEFDWFINVHGDAIKFLNEHEGNRCSIPYETRVKKRLELQETVYTHIFTSCINFEDAKSFKKKFGKFIRPNQWKNITMRIYMR